jgi:hypothetical protein
MSEKLELRPAVLEFAEEIEKALRRNDAEKGDSWRTLPIEQLHYITGKEVVEYCKAESDEESAKECVDCGALFMMLYHRHKKA